MMRNGDDNYDADVNLIMAIGMYCDTSIPHKLFISLPLSLKMIAFVVGAAGVVSTIAVDGGGRGKPDVGGRIRGHHRQIGGVASG